MFADQRHVPSPRASHLVPWPYFLQDMHTGDAAIHDFVQEHSRKVPFYDLVVHKCVRLLQYFYALLSWCKLRERCLLEFKLGPALKVLHVRWMIQINLATPCGIHVCLWTAIERFIDYHIDSSLLWPQLFYVSNLSFRHLRLEQLGYRVVQS